MNKGYKSFLKRILFCNSILYRFLPYIFFARHPVKLYEYKELLRGVAFNKDDTVIDLGCGEGYHSALLRKRCGKIIGIDPDQNLIKSYFIELLAKHHENVYFICGELKDAKLKDNTIDKVISFCVIEHIPNYKEVFKDIYRILKKGGQFIATVDSLGTINEKHIIDKHKEMCSVFHYFSKESLITTLEQIGFRNTNVYPILKSNYARKLFIKSIETNRDYFPTLISLLTYIFLKKSDKNVRESSKGIFLIARCQK